MDSEQEDIESQLSVIKKAASFAQLNNWECKSIDINNDLLINYLEAESPRITKSDKRLTIIMSLIQYFLLSNKFERRIKCEKIYLLSVILILIISIILTMIFSRIFLILAILTIYQAFHILSMLDFIYKSRKEMDTQYKKDITELEELE
ncbi:MAG: hypothetical protein FWE36_08155 [Erysipelotrichales bacterium]|nr:hypothetical protein [Erysipelotrichales bacterium]